MAVQFPFVTCRSAGRLGKLAMDVRDLLNRLTGESSLKLSPIMSRRQHLAAVRDATRRINRGRRWGGSPWTVGGAEPWPRIPTRAKRVCVAIPRQTAFLISPRFSWCAEGKLDGCPVDAGRAAIDLAWGDVVARRVPGVRRQRRRSTSVSQRSIEGAPASWPRRYSWWGAELLFGTYEVQVVDTLSPCDPFIRRGTQEGW